MAHCVAPSQAAAAYPNFLYTGSIPPTTHSHQACQMPWTIGHSLQKYGYQQALLVTWLLLSFYPLISTTNPRYHAAYSIHCTHTHNALAASNLRRVWDPGIGNVPESIAIRTCIISSESSEDVEDASTIPSPSRERATGPTVAGVGERPFINYYCREAVNQASAVESSQCQSIDDVPKKSVKAESSIPLCHPSIRPSCALLFGPSFAINLLKPTTKVSLEVLDPSLPSRTAPILQSNCYRVVKSFQTVNLHSNPTSTSPLNLSISKQPISDAIPNWCCVLLNYPTPYIAVESSNPPHQKTPHSNYCCRVIESVNLSDYPPIKVDSPLNTLSTVDSNPATLHSNWCCQVIKPPFAKASTVDSNWSPVVESLNSNPPAIEPGYITRYSNPYAAESSTKTLELSNCFYSRDSQSPSIY